MMGTSHSHGGVVVQMRSGSLDSPSAAGTRSADSFLANVSTFSLNFSMADRFSYLVGVY